MNVLVVYCHPNPLSFNQAILETTVELLKEQGHVVHIRDLYALSFNPALGPTDFQAFQSGQIPPDIAIEQEEIRWANRLVVIHPIWWTNMPALLKGYIDRVLFHGFAYTYVDGQPNGLLTDKEVIIINTSGTPNEIYQQSGMHDAIRAASDVGVYQFCGIKVLAHLFYGAVPHVDDQTRKGYLEELREELIRLG
ncbi:MAG: NAD(P)H-dependent oxidoreductase [bacterium]|jgi:NAD(P)H dehydrogenase (quinone)|nr:NAD(P)H-dependent oxidoreductase [bacterium]